MDSKKLQPPSVVVGPSRTPIATSAVILFVLVAPIALALYVFLPLRERKIEIEERAQQLAVTTIPAIEQRLTEHTRSTVEEKLGSVDVDAVLESVLNERVSAALGANRDQLANEIRQEILRELGSRPSQATGPVGTIVAWYGTKDDLAAYPNWLACDGSTFSNGDYPDLAARLGKLQTPDLRGMFLRGISGDRSVGSSQEDAMQRCDVFAYTTNPSGTQGAVGVFVDDVHNTRFTKKTLYERLQPPRDSGRKLRLADETRPKNVAVLWIIKAR